MSKCDPPFVVDMWRVVVQVKGVDSRRRRKLELIASSRVHIGIVVVAIAAVCLTCKTLRDISVFERFIAICFRLLILLLIFHSYLTMLTSVF